MDFDHLSDDSLVNPIRPTYERMFVRRAEKPKPGTKWGDPDFARPKSGNNPFKLGPVLQRKVGAALDRYEVGEPAQEGEAYKAPFGVRRLAAAVIDEALWNITGTITGEGFYCQGTRQEAINSAVVWLSGPSDARLPFSFAWCCDRLGIPVSWLRTSVACWAAFGGKLPKGELTMLILNASKVAKRKLEVVQ